MRTFSCDACGNTLFFENDTCVQCGSKVGFRADDLTMATVDRAQASGIAPCRNWAELNACNWYATGDAARDNGYCLACSFDDEVPDLSDPQRLALWTETERAKRRLIYTLLGSGCRSGPRPTSADCASGCSRTSAWDTGASSRRRSAQW